MNSFLKTTLALLLATTWTFGQHPTTENVRLTTPDLTLDGTLTGTRHNHKKNTGHSIDCRLGRDRPRWKQQGGHFLRCLPDIGR